MGMIKACTETHKLKLSTKQNTPIINTLGVWVNFKNITGLTFQLSFLILVDLSWTSLIKDYFRPPSTTAFLLRPSNPTLLLGLFQHSFGTGLLYLFLKLVEGLFQMLKWEKGFVKRNLSTFNWRIYDLNLNMNQRVWVGMELRCVFQTAFHAPFGCSRQIWSRK